MTKKLFEYSIGLCWGTTYTIIIFDKKENNTVLIKDPGGPYCSYQRKAENTITLAENKIDGLKDIINRNQEIFTMGEIEFPPVCDGDGGSFFFSNGLKNKKGGFSNLWYFVGGYDTYRDHRKGIVSEPRDIGKAKNAKILINILNQIFDLLKGEKIAHKFLQYGHE